MNIFVIQFIRKKCILWFVLKSLQLDVLSNQIKVLEIVHLFNFFI